LTDISLLFLPDSLDLRGKGMPYRRFTGDLQIRNGIVRSENILLESPALRAGAVGQFDLAEETLDVTMAIRPFQTLDAVLSKIPVAGWILRGKDGNLVVAYARASGSIQDPKIEALPLKSIGGSLFGKLRERLDLPEGSGAPDDGRSPEPEGKERLDH